MAGKAGSSSGSHFQEVVNALRGHAAVGVVQRLDRFVGQARVQVPPLEQPLVFVAPLVFREDRFPGRLDHLLCTAQAALQHPSAPSTPLSPLPGTRILQVRC